MSEGEMVVCRFSDGRVLKGFTKEFRIGTPEILVREASGSDGTVVRIDDLKALFFVRCFEGDCGHKEKKTYGISKQKGNRVFIKFRDGESLVGYLEGDVPWKRGFFLSRKDPGMQGFYLLPVDEESNNIKVFVVASSVDAVTVVP